MKKKVICVFSLILYLLVACTILSNWIETEMMTQVKISERQNRGDSFTFGQSALFSDGEEDHLYEVIDGTGWNSGLRSRELSPSQWYSDAYGKVQFDGSEQTYRFIVSASRQPQEGDEVAVIESFEKAEDQYLCIYSDGIPEEIVLPKNTEIDAQSETVLLLNQKEAEFPFFEQTAKGLTDTMAAADQIISLTESEQFLTGLPSLALAAMILLAGVVLWAFTCLLSIHSEGNKWRIRLNAVIMIALLGYLAFLLQTVELPASMLPAENIFDLQFYSEKFTAIFSSLDALSSESHSVVTAYQTAITDSRKLTQNSGIVILAFILAESMVLLIRSWLSKRKKKYVGKYLRKCA